jgi:hypothetical protein
MDVSGADDGGRKRPPATETGLDSGPPARPSPAATTRTLIVAILLATAAAWVTSTVADRFRGVENVEHGAKYRGTRLSVETAARNAAVSYGLLGAVLSLSLGVTAGGLPGRFSAPRALTAGLAGVALGAILGAASSYVLTPVYFHRLETADVTLAVLVHLGIWTAVGASSGFAFGVGSGDRAVFARSLVGGIAGAALGTILFDVSGAFFPHAHTERPLAEAAGTRLAANMILCVCVAVGTVVVASQEPRAAAKKT